MGQKLDIEVNTPTCSGCRICEMVCTLYHEDVINLEKARIRIVDDYEHSLFVPHICRLCDSPDCADACPMGALTQDIQTKVVTVDKELCNGCQACIEACSYGAIRWSDELERVFVCDRCGGDPTCVQFCTSGALKLVAAG